TLDQLAGYLGKSAAQNVNQQESLHSLAQSPNQEIRTFVSSQDAESVTQKNLDIDFLKNLEAYTVGRVKTKIRELPNSPKIDITSEATYVESGPMKLAIIRLRGSDSSNQVFVLGIMGKELKRVICIRNSTETIPVSYGVCADKIKEVFGTKFGV
ncbi:MAG: hypothetical protein ABI656_11035, partial [bacterium]